MDYSLPGSSVHGILQARTLEWVAIPFSRGSSWLRHWTKVSCTAGSFFTIWAPSWCNLILNRTLFVKGRVRTVYIKITIPSVRWWHVPLEYWKGLISPLLGSSSIIPLLWSWLLGKVLASGPLPGWPCCLPSSSTLGRSMWLRRQEPLCTLPSPPQSSCPYFNFVLGKISNI